MNRNQGNYTFFSNLTENVENWKMQADEVLFYRVDNNNSNNQLNNNTNLKNLNGNDDNQVRIEIAL